MAKEMRKMEAKSDVTHFPTLYKAINAAKLGREVLLHYFGRLESVETKYQAGLVSEADRESERVIFEYLKSQFPEDDFLGEESAPSSYSAKIPESKRGRWIVDPLDGTTNYIHGFPIFAVSIAYEFSGKVRLGVVDIPFLNEVYSAIEGKGSFVNGRPLKVSHVKTLNDSFLCTGFVNDNEQVLQEQLHLMNRMIRECRGIRRTGSAAYDLCMVAKGIFDAYWEKGLKPWDGAAGQLLVEEAGGLVTTYRGKPYHPYCKTILAGNPTIAQALQKMILPEIHESSD